MGIEMMNQLRTATETNNKPGRRARYLRAFRRDEDGGIIVLTLLLLIVMLVMGGMALISCGMKRNE